MKNIHKDFVFDEDLVRSACDNEKFAARFEALLADMEAFVKALECQDKAKVNSLILAYALVDYFEDIRRLKDFHILEHINAYKVVSYISFWILRRRPIQLLVSNDKSLIDINEKFVLVYILEFLSTVEGKDLLNSDIDSIQGYIDSLFYYLKYRCDSATSLEMMLLAFQAGQVYENPDLESGNKLSRYK